MLHVSASSALSSRKDVSPYSASHRSEMPRPNRHSLKSSAVLIVPLMDESHADLLMIPIPEDNTRFNKSARHQHSPSCSITTTSRTETPAAPTPAPKPQLPEGCDDWDSYLSQRKSSATTLAVYEDEGDWVKPAVAPTERLQSPELNFKHSFEQLGWRDCLNKKQRQKANATTARTLRQVPSAATTLLLPLVYDATSPGNSSSATSLRSVKRLSNASTLTVNTAATSTNISRTTKRLSVSSTNTAATVPCYLPSTVYKRLSGASTLTTNTTATVPCYLPSTAYKRLSGASTLTFASTSTLGKPRSLRRINRARHLRAYYSDGSLLRGRRLSVGITSMQGIAERREPVRPAVKKRSMALAGELCAPPPFPPPEKPLPSLPVVEVRELQTSERTRWRQLLRGLPRGREASRRRAESRAGSVREV